MPAHVLVYCRRAVDHLTPEMLTAELKDADLMTLAECHHLPEGEEEAVHEMWRHYRLEAQGPSIDGVELHWHAKQRPIQLSAGPPLPGELEETLENLPDDEGEGPARVREHLKQTRQVVDFEMGIDGSHHLAATISEVLAFFVAEKGDGLVWFFHREFASPDDRGANLWKTED